MPHLWTAGCRRFVHRGVVLRAIASNLVKVILGDERGTLWRPMAVYTTFFAATASELERAFSGWRKPLANPVKRTRVNPITKKVQTYDSWEPEEILTQSISDAKLRVIEGHGEYQSYQRERLPGALRTLPQLLAKGVLSPHVEQLFTVVAGRTEERLVPALFPAGGSATGKTLDILPAWGVISLADVRPDAVASIGQQLATADGWFADEGWAAEDCAGLLEGLHGLALKARDLACSMYLLTEA